MKNLNLDQLSSWELTAKSVAFIAQIFREVLDDIVSGTPYVANYRRQLYSVQPALMLDGTVGIMFMHVTLTDTLGNPTYLRPFNEIPRRTIVLENAIRMGIVWPHYDRVIDEAIATYNWVAVIPLHVAAEAFLNGRIELN